MAESRSKRSRKEITESIVLYMLVFTGGTVLMATEIAGARLLTPFFGSAVFVWGSLISVVMMALAAGYYGGGRFADRYPSLTVLSGIVGVAGLSLLLMPGIAVPVNTFIERSDLGPKMGPLISSMVLFLIPGVLIATISPFAIKLSAKDLAGLGNVAGRLNALSTTGSIIGTLLATFVLIPVMGTRQLIFALGIVLILASIVAMLLTGKPGLIRTRNIISIVVVSGVTGLFAAPSGPGAEITHIYEKNNPHTLIEWKDSAYHLIMVTEQKHAEPGTGVERPRRLLRFNDRTQSAIYIDNLDENGRAASIESAVEYTDLLHVAMIFKPDARNALFIGGGGGIGPTEFAQHYGIDSTMVEIDPEVVRISQEYFYLDESVKIVVGDGRKALGDLDEQFDLIVLDAYSSGGHIPEHLTTVEFIERCMSRLSPDGVLVSNVISALAGDKSRFYQSQVKTMRAAGFDNVYTFPRFLTPAEQRIRGTRKEQYVSVGMNIILIATRGDRMSHRDVESAARRLVARPEKPVKIENFLHYVSGMRVEDPDRLHGGMILTDNYCPVETMHHF